MRSDGQRPGPSRGEADVLLGAALGGLIGLLFDHPLLGLLIGTAVAAMLAVQHRRRQRNGPDDGLGGGPGDR